MKDRCSECRHKMENHGILDDKEIYYCDICGIYQSYPLQDEEALLAAEKKNCGCGKDPCMTYGAETKKNKNKVLPMSTYSCIACGHHSAHIKMGDDRFCNDCYHYAETFEAPVKTDKFQVLLDMIGKRVGEGKIDGRQGAILKRIVTDHKKRVDEDTWKYRKGGKRYEEMAENNMRKKLMNTYSSMIRKKNKAETFNSYKVAPELSSYTVDELVASKAGPQGSAAYDEMVYDPIAQDRLSAESISIPHTLLLLGGIVAGLGFGVFLTKGLKPKTSDEGGA